MQSPDSSTGEPAALRRRVDLHGGFIGCAVQRNGHQSPEPAAAEGISTEFDEFLDWSVTLQRVVSIASRDFNNTVAGESNTSKEETGSDKCRTTEVRNYGSGAAGVGQHDKCFVASDTSESCKRTWRGDVSRRDAARCSEKETNQSCYTEDDSANDPRNLSPPFVGSLYPVSELSEAYERASEALNQENKRKATVSSVIAQELSKVSRLTYRFQTLAISSVWKVVNRSANGVLERSDVCSDRFEKKLGVIKSYLVQVYNEAECQQSRKSPVTQVLGGQSAFNSIHLTLEATSDEETTMRETRRTIRRAVISVRHQWKVMTKLCDIAERFVSKAEISCQLILDCLTTTVTAVTRAVVTSTLIEQLMRALDNNGQSLPALRNASSVTAQWTLEAIFYAERAMDLHSEACVALRIARCDTNVMRQYRLRGSTVLNDTTVAGNRLVDLVRQSKCANLPEIRNLKSHMKTLRHVLMPDLIEMREFVSVIEDWSTTCSDTVTTVLQTMSLATKSSCTAIAEAVKVGEYIFVPAGIS